VSAAPCHGVGFSGRRVIKYMSQQNIVVSRLAKNWATLCAALCFAAAAMAQIPADKVHVDVPAQNLLSALTQFGRDTGTEIEFAPEAVRGKTSIAIRGDFDRMAAIKLLLTGTGLSYRVLPQGAIVIEPSPLGAGTAGVPSPRRAQSVAANPAPLGALTVEGRRQREETKRQIQAFVNSVARPAWDESLATWQIPICPLVAGMPRDMGEFMLRRLSEAARNADAPLAAEKCHPNFLVVITSQADDLVKQWRRRYPRAFNEKRGVAGIKRFLTSPLPVRIWYNVDDGCPGSLTYDIAVNSSNSKSFPFPSCSHTGRLGSRLVQEVVRVISSVIVVADTDRIKNLNIGQLADYVAMIGMAEIRLDQGLSPAPSILRLFGDADESRPQELTVWDKSFLKGLYDTYPDDATRVSNMESRMLEYLMQ
jgi:hypothetical protein